MAVVTELFRSEDNGTLCYPQKFSSGENRDRNHHYDQNQVDHVGRKDRRDFICFLFHLCTHIIPSLISLN